MLTFDTAFPQGNITNLPFIVREANATDMKATFWIMELEAGGFIMMYSQTVMLDFFDSPLNPGEKVRWPHVSINTLRKE